VTTKYCSVVMDVHVEVGLINDLTNELPYHTLQCDNTHQLRLCEEVWGRECEMTRGGWNGMTSASTPLSPYKEWY